jgi:prepilin-type N-terminal cleavage/methylation domain-containing protein
MKRESTSRAAHSGFTLVEIVVVVAVLGILATVAVFSVRGITDRGEQSSCKTDRDVLMGAVEHYFAREFGATIAISDPPVPGVTGITAEDTLVEREYIDVASIRHDVEPAGTVTVAAGSGC